MQDPDDSDAAPHDMVLNKEKRNKGIAAPFCTKGGGIPLLFLQHGGPSGRHGSRPGPGPPPGSLR